MALDRWIHETMYLMGDIQSLDARHEVERRISQSSIYRVPKHLKDVNTNAYMPKLVSLGPYHHGRQYLRPMEYFKSLCCARFLCHMEVQPRPVLDAMKREINRLLYEYDGLRISIVNDMEDYLGPTDEDELLIIMVVDSCFALYVMQSDGNPTMEAFFKTYASGLLPRDFMRDMLLLENQLPFVGLDILNNIPKKNTIGVSFKIAAFFDIELPESVDSGERSYLHILDLYRKCRIAHGGYLPGGVENLRSATELNYAGISIRPNATRSFKDINIHGRVLRLPPLLIDDDTESLMLNLMSFERLHLEAGNEVSAYAFFMDSLLRTTEDVALLRKREIIKGLLGYDEKVLKMFKRIIKEQTNSIFLQSSWSTDISYKLNNHCERASTKFRANFMYSFWKDPISFSTFWLGVVIIFVLTLIQTIFAVLSYKQPQNGH